MVYTDGVHLIADDIYQLHAFAEYIGLKRDWFQDHRHPHYDLKGRMRRKAMTHGALVVDARTLVKISNSAKRLQALETIGRIQRLTLLE